MTPAEASRLLAKLRAAYPRQDIPAATLGLYAEMLADLDAKEADAAVREHIASSQFFPTVAEIRQRAARRLVGSEPAELQWGNMLSLVSRFGRYRYAEAEQAMDPITARAVRAVGWESICNTEAPGIERSAFIRAYAAALASAEREANMGRLESARGGVKTLPAPAGVAQRELKPAKPADLAPPQEVRELIERVSLRWGDDNDPEAA